MTPSDWTVDTLHEHLQRQLDQQRQEADRRSDRAETEMREHIAAAALQLSTALEASEKAIAKADAATELRFHNVNEFRAVLTAQQASFLTIAVYDSAHRALVEKIDAIDRAAAVTHRNLDEKINANSSSIIEIRTASSTTTSNRTLLISIIGLLLVVASVGFAFYGVTKR